MDLNNYGFKRSELLVAAAVNVYLQGLTPEARKETLSSIVKSDGDDVVIDEACLSQLLESVKAAAMISSEGWKCDGGSFMKRTFDYIRDTLPTIDEKEFAKAPPKEFMKFIEDWSKE